VSAIPGLACTGEQAGVAGIHRAARSGACGFLDTGDKPRYDTKGGPGDPGQSRVNQVAILYPVFVQVLLVVVVGMSMAAARARAVKTMDRQRGNPDLAMGRVAWPDDATKRAANYRNQFEGPVLFYAVVAFALITKGADTLMIVLAWLFVLTRIVHAAIHIGPNKVRWRSPAFALGFLIVVLMWIKLAVHVTTAGLA
jgi:hypothetical protein